VVRIHSCPVSLYRFFFEPPRFFFEPPRFLPRVDFLALRFAERDLDELRDFFARLLPRLAFRPPDLFFPRVGLRRLDLLRAADFDFFAPPPVFFFRLFAAARAGFFAFAATAFTAFLAVDAAVLCAAALRPTTAPITPPTTAPTGPATLPRTAPVAAPAASFEIGGIWMLSDDELELSLDC
jgi:hypothetical protein